MSRKTQRYSKEFKAEAVRTVLENQLSISEGASRLSLPEGTLGQWVTAARKGLGTPGSRTVAELESEILQLRKALNEARLERDILKKATGNDSNLLIVFYVQIMPDDLVMQLHRF
ncbi:transposase [Escherichia coli]|nr:transposase [Escherichia coli]QIV73504.1 transposase [Escherichia coli]